MAEFPLKRGLRQGDPLSPLLFLLAAEGFHVLMDSLSINNLFSGYHMGRSEPVIVSHLKFVDDTLILGEKSWSNVRGMRVVLLLFKSLSDLKVNFSKSQLVGVNVVGSWLSEAARLLQCRAGSLPFVYLGLTIGGNVRHMSFWEPIIDRIKARLSGWKLKTFIFGRSPDSAEVCLAIFACLCSFFLRLRQVSSPLLNLYLITFFWGGVLTTGKYLGWTGIRFVGVRRLVAWE